MTKSLMKRDAGVSTFYLLCRRTGTENHLPADFVRLVFSEEEADAFFGAREFNDLEWRAYCLAFHNGQYAYFRGGPGV